MKHIKIALTGKMRAGKDTVYKMIEDELNYPKAQVTQLSFGEQLKHYANELFPYKVRDGKPRKLYQDFGQLMRQIDPDVWVNQVDELLEQQEGYVFYFDKEERGLVISVITDLRQPNEYEYCKDNGFHIVRVNASDKARMVRMESTKDVVTVGDLNHETEQHIDTYRVDYEIENEGLHTNAIYNLELQVEQVLTDILKKEGVTDDQYK